ncbi:GNAT family N-acetyltransferase [Alsobacter sp. R-9]
MEPAGDIALVRAIEERSFNAWPALEVAVLDGWLLRFAEGYSKRANSANALAPTGRFATLLPLIETLYRRHGLKPCVRITPLAGDEPGRVLDGAGWTSVDESVVMVAPMPRGLVEHETASLSAAADRAWIDGYAEASARPDLRRDTLARMLAAIRPEVVFATLRDDEAGVAYGMAVLERGMVGLYDIAVPAAARGKGHGRRVVETLLAWGRRRGAMQAYLQVTTGNATALGLYRSLGFRELYGYDYRLPPS